MPFFKRSLAGPAFVILNVIRVCNIISLLAVVAASFVMLIKTFVISKFFFFDGVSHVITGFIAIALIITELPIFRRYIALNWPLLSPSSGFVTLGMLMIIVGVSILGNLNKQATSQDSLGTSFWRIVIASGVVTCIFGVVNIFASFMFRNKALDITARQVRAHGSTAVQKVYHSPSVSTKPSTRRRSFHLNRSSTLPTYNPNTRPMVQSPQGNRNISAPVGVPPAMNTQQTDDLGIKRPVPVVEGVQRPDLVFHPAYQNTQF